MLHATSRHTAVSYVRRGHRRDRVGVVCHRRRRCYAIVITVAAEPARPTNQLSDGVCLSVFEEEEEEDHPLLCC